MTTALINAIEAPETAEELQAYQAMIAPYYLTDEERFYTRRNEIKVWRVEGFGHVMVSGSASYHVRSELRAAGYQFDRIAGYWSQGFEGGKAETDAAWEFLAGLKDLALARFNEEKAAKKAAKKAETLGRADSLGVTVTPEQLAKYPAGVMIGGCTSDYRYIVEMAHDGRNWFSRTNEGCSRASNRTAWRATSGYAIETGQVWEITGRKVRLPK